MPVEWDEIYSLGIGEIDKQHQNFVRMLAEVNKRYGEEGGGARKPKNKMEVYLDVLKLREYALYHFHTEEKYMIKYKYPHYFDHKKEHDQFLRKVLDMEDKLMNTEEAITDEMIGFIGNWFDHHLRKIDAQFGKFLKYSGIIATAVPIPSR